MYWFQLVRTNNGPCVAGSTVLWCAAGERGVVTFLCGLGGMVCVALQVLWRG